MTGRLHVSIICVYLRLTLLWPWYLQSLESTNVVAKGTRRRTHDAPYCRYTGEARWLSLLSRDNLHSYCEGHAKEAPICALHMRSTFQQKHTFGMICDHWLKDERAKEFDRIKKQYPERIPVICEKAEKSDMPPISKKKYLAPSVCILVFIHWRTWLLVNLFMWYVRRLNFLLIKLFSSVWTASFLLHQLPCTTYMLCIKMMTVSFTLHIQEKILSMCDKLV